MNVVLYWTENLGMLPLSQWSITGCQWPWMGHIFHLEKWKKKKKKPVEREYALTVDPDKILPGVITDMNASFTSPEMSCIVVVLPGFGGIWPSMALSWLVDCFVEGLSAVGGVTWQSEHVNGVFTAFSEMWSRLSRMSRAGWSGEHCLWNMTYGSCCRSPDEAVFETEKMNNGGTAFPGAFRGHSVLLLSFSRCYRTLLLLSSPSPLQSAWVSVL